MEPGGQAALLERDQRGAAFVVFLIKVFAGTMQVSIVMDLLRNCKETVKFRVCAANYPTKRRKAAQSAASNANAYPQS